jgi:hypothetical protein
MTKTTRRLAAVVLGMIFLIGAATAKWLYSALYDYRMESKDAARLIVEEVGEVHPKHLQILVEPMASALVVRKISTDERGDILTLQYHLALAGRVQPELVWGQKYELVVPDSVREVRFGRDAKRIWRRAP